MSERILVTGATATVGRELVGLLVDSGAEVKAGTRHPDRAADLYDASVEIVELDSSLDPDEPVGRLLVRHFDSLRSVRRGLERDVVYFLTSGDGAECLDLLARLNDRSPRGEGEAIRNGAKAELDACFGADEPCENEDDY